MHPVGPHDPRAQPLRMINQQMKRRTLDRDARLLEPDTKLGKDAVEETLIPRIVCQPAHNVGARMCRDAILAWRRAHICSRAEGQHWVNHTAYSGTAPPMVVRCINRRCGKS